MEETKTDYTQGSAGLNHKRDAFAMATFKPSSVHPVMFNFASSKGWPPTPIKHSMKWGIHIKTSLWFLRSRAQPLEFDVPLSLPQEWGLARSWLWTFAQCSSYSHCSCRVILRDPFGISRWQQGRPLSTLITFVSSNIHHLILLYTLSQWPCFVVS